MSDYTPDALLAAALAHNAEYPAAAEEIPAGTPTLRISAKREGAAGREVRVVASWGVRLPDGGFAYAQDPHSTTIRSNDGRLSAVDVAARSPRFRALMADARKAGIAVDLVAR